MVSDLNSDNTARGKLLKIGLELAGPFFYVGNFPEDLAVRIENGWAIFCAAQRLLPAIEQWVGGFHTLRARLRAITFRAPLSR